MTARAPARPAGPQPPPSVATRVIPGVVGVLATVALWVASPTLGDLQAAIAREQAAESGVGLGYWFGWYGGVSPGSYSLIVPALSTVFGSMALLAMATIVIAGMAYPIAHARSGATSEPTAVRPALLTWAIVAAAVLNMMSGRVAFAVGAAFALGAVLLMQRRQAGLAATALVVSGLASPLTPAFVGLVAVPLLLGSGWRSRDLWTVLVGAGLGVAIPFALFGAPGAQGFPWTTLCWTVAIGVCATVAVRSSPERWIAPFATGVAMVIFAFPNGVGSNVSRFFCLVVPCLVLFYSRRSLIVVLVAVMPAVGYAGFVAIADQVAVSDAGDPEQSYEPLRLALLRGPGLINHRVELVDAGTHAGSHELGPLVKLARGWENQSDSRFNPIFYAPGALTADSYRTWLTDNAVSWVAVSADPLRQARHEAALVSSGLPYLSAQWSDANWTLYRVDDPGTIVRAPLRMVSDSPSQMVIDVPDVGTHTMQIRPNRYLVARNVADTAEPACIGQTPDGWTTLRAPVPGRYVVQGALSVRGVLAEQPPACSA